MPTEATRHLMKLRLSAEVGRINKEAPHKVALVYPSPYNVGMSSLGFQRVYRAVQAMPGVCCERAFLPDQAAEPGGQVEERPITYEGQRELGEFPVILLSVAYELELAGLVKLLEASAIPALAKHRDARHPIIVAGGPLTFSNPLPLAAFVDAIVLGEAEELIEPVVEAALYGENRTKQLEALASLPSVFVPALHGELLPKVAAAADSLLPAHSAIVTPHTELSNMFLIEAERGCSRGCTYCVMRRSTNGGMRIVPKELLFEKIPAGTRRVGLVGAAVSDHPKIVEIVHGLADRGIEVGLSSLRPDRLKDEFVGALKRGGYRTLTTALDGPSERMRGIIERRGREPNYVQAAELARKHGMDRLKLYLMVGLPGETDIDIDECARFVTELSRIVPIALGVAPFCAKRNTPLDRMPYAGVAVVLARLERLRKGLKGRAEVRSTSAKWAWVEYVLSQGGVAESEALYAAVRAGGRYADYRREFRRLGHTPDGAGYPDAVPPIAPERAKMKRLALVNPS